MVKEVKKKNHRAKFRAREGGRDREGRKNRRDDVAGGFVRCRPWMR